MSIAIRQVADALSPPMPSEVVEHLLHDYREIKTQFFLRKFRPSELDGGRFAESVLRLLEFRDTEQYTPYGKQLASESVIKHLENNTGLGDSERLLIPRQARVLLDVRNKRNVAHPAGDVDPNFSDSLFIVHAADWILTELIRLYYASSIDDAKKIVAGINQVSIPIVADVDGFLRVQNTNLDARKKVLVILYHRDPEKVADGDLVTWLRYGNSSRLKNDLLRKLDTEALIHYQDGMCSLLPKGKLYVEREVPPELLG
jgi:hypothetical protein